MLYEIWKRQQEHISWTEQAKRAGVSKLPRWDGGTRRTH